MSYRFPEPATGSLSTDPCDQSGNQNVQPPLTVSQLNRAGKDLIETYLPQLWVEGELSNVSKPASGHWYFTLKDTRAQVRCAMFRNRNLHVRFKPESGKKVLLKAKASLYEGRGDFQLLVDEIRPAGQGDLQLAFDELKANLLKRGWFDDSQKKALPVWPKRIAVLTSPTGAVIHDMARVLGRRCPSIEINVVPISVQGKNAVPEIVRALTWANEAKLGEVIVLARGGGSLEDLWAFNEEPVAKAIFDSQLPVVSAVGHEVDFTIADFVADIRAPTPSVAAELVSPNSEEKQRELQTLLTRLHTAVIQQTTTYEQKVKYLHARLKHPGERLQAQAQGLDFLESRLHQAITKKITLQQQTSDKLRQNLHYLSPQKRVQETKQNVKRLMARLSPLINQKLHGKQKEWQYIVKRLNAISPLNTLQRGFAIVEDTQQHVVTEAGQIDVGDTLHIRLSNGALHSTVTWVEEKK